jgi:hypothetical protein
VNEQILCLGRKSAGFLRNVSQEFPLKDSGGDLFLAIFERHPDLAIAELPDRKVGML